MDSCVFSPRQHLLPILPSSTVLRSNILFILRGNIVINNRLFSPRQHLLLILQPTIILRSNFLFILWGNILINGRLFSPRQHWPPILPSTIVLRSNIILFTSTSSPLTSNRLRSSRQQSSSYFNNCPLSSRQQ